MAQGPAGMTRSLGRSPAGNDRHERKAKSSPSGAGNRTSSAGPAAPARATTVLVVPKSMPRVKLTEDSVVSSSGPPAGGELSAKLTEGIPTGLEPPLSRASRH